MALKKFILEERNYSPVQGIPSPSQLIIPALTLAIKNEFSSKVEQVPGKAVEGTREQAQNLGRRSGFQFWFHHFLSK